MPGYVLISLMLGLVAGIAVTLLAVHERMSRASAAAATALAERQRALDVLQGTVRDQSTRIHDLDVQLRELDAVRSTRAALSAELDRTRQALSAATEAANEARESARVTEERFHTESRVGERTAAADRAVHDAELAAARQAAESLRGELVAEREGARQAVDSLRAELDAEREAAERAQHALETERDRSHAAFETELATTRSALRRVEAEWAASQAELAELRHDVEMRRRELDTDRRNAAAVEAALRAELASAREARAETAAELDRIEREAAVLKARMASAEHAMHQLRADAAARLAAEHRRGMDLVSRLWAFARPGPGEESPATRTDGPAFTRAVAGDREVPVSTAGLADVAAPAAPDAACANAPAPAPMENAGGGAAAAASSSNGDAAPAGEPPPADVALTVHRLPPHLRKPVAVLREDGDGGALILCNDGSLWERGADGDWQEVMPLPGSQREAVQRFYNGVDARSLRAPKLGSACRAFVRKSWGRRRTA